MGGMFPTPPAPPRTPTLTRAQARVVWTVIAVVLAAAVVAALTGAAAVPPDAPSPIGTVFLLVAGPMVVIDLGVAYFITSRMRRRAAPGALAGAVAGTQVIVASAIALGAGLMCCVFFFVAREPLLLLLVLPCAAVLLHWFPSEARWAAITPGAAAPAGRNPPASRNRMMRE
jgi:hypothetical protein